MASINLIKASDGTGNASTATVQTVRNSGVTTIIVDTVNNIPATFMGSMGTPHTFVDPVTSEEITVISEATAVDFTGHVSGANLEIDSIAPGYTDLGSAVGDIIVIRPTTEWANNIATVLAVAHNLDGTLKDGIITNAKLASWAGEIGGSWLPYVPALTNITLGNGTIDAKFSRHGKLVFFNVQIVFGSTTSITAAWPTFGLPILPTGAGWCTQKFLDSGITNYFGGYGIAPGVWAVNLVAANTSSTYLQEAGISPTTPHIWAVNDVINAYGYYEAA